MLIPVALVQFDAVPENPEGNLAGIERLTRDAVGLGARWVMFHEGAVCDYTPNLEELAEEVPGGRSTRRMTKLARDLNCHLSFGLSEREGDRYYITQVFVSPDGFTHSYRKTWIWRSETDEGYRNEWARYDPGTGPSLFDFDGVKATCFICADGEAPRCVARAAALRPEIVFYPNNRGGLPDFGPRAKAIGAPMLVTNRVGRSWSSDCRGGCAIYSSSGRPLARANNEGREEILSHVMRIARR
jgi:predicted amidohydrolase